jgi:Uma2 family endonuclease
MMAQSVRWTSSDLELFPEDGKRREIVDGELFTSHQPHTFHQMTCTNGTALLHRWSSETGAGFVIGAPGLIFGPEDDVAPDLVWISTQNLATALGADGKLHAAPELVIEVLSPGATNERRDREAKLKLYGQRGVREYWIVSWQRREVEVYRRSELTLQRIGVLLESDTLSSPHLPGFSCTVGDLFAGIPQTTAQE